MINETMSVLVKPEHRHADRRSPEYLAQLLSDKKQLQVLPNVFLHVEKILDEEISKVRSGLFHLTDDNEVLQLPQPSGPIVILTEKLHVPVAEYPDFNFVGRILGPRGMTAKQLETDTGCKIMVRGKGSMRDKQKEEQNRGKANWEHLNEDLHVLITVEDTQNRAEIKIRRAAEEVKKLLVPTPDGEDDLKRRQLMELAIINGTYRDTTTSPAAGQALNQASLVAAMPLPVSQAPRLIATSPVAIPAMLPAPSVPGGGTQFILAPRLPHFTPATSSMATPPTMLASGPPPPQIIQTTDAAAGFIYPYDPYRFHQLFEYSGSLEQSAAGAATKFRRTVTYREHPYMR
jgi:protein quaking